MLKQILIIDDDEELNKHVISSFSGDCENIIVCTTKDQAIKFIDSLMVFDLIILDWHLEDDDSSEISQYILQYLNNKVFVPVFIWSNHISEFDQALSDGKILYPKVLIETLSKADLTPGTIKEKVLAWINHSLVAKISNVYRKKIHEKLEKSFFELSKSSDANMASILKVVVGVDENIDWSNDFILNIIHRQLILDGDFKKELVILIKAANSISGVRDTAERDSIVNKILYYRAETTNLRSGDIVRITKDGKNLKLGIVVTPDCDIEQKSTRYLECAELIPIDDTNSLKLNSGQKISIREFKNDSYYFFPAIQLPGEGLSDFVAIIKAKFILKNIFTPGDEKYPSPPCKIEYGHKYECEGQEVELSYICSKCNPYKNSFFQKFNASVSRVGFPDIKELYK